VDLEPLQPVERLTCRASGYLHIGPGFAGGILDFVGLEQDASMGQMARRGVAAAIKSPSMPRSSSLRLTGFFLFLGMGRLLMFAAARPPGRMEAPTLPEMEDSCKPITSRH
jgi:hypothetical protein